MKKTYKLTDYLKAMAKQDDTQEDKFLIVQNRINKNLSKDIIDLLNSLESGGIPAPKDFVFMTYFAMFWNRMMIMYNDTQEKQDIINIFNSIMHNVNNINDSIENESIN